MTYYLLPVGSDSEKTVKIPHPTASDGISRERFKQGSCSFTGLLETIGPTHVPETTSLVAAGRLPNAIKYCTQVRKNGLAGQSVE